MGKTKTDKERLADYEETVIKREDTIQRLEAENFNLTKANENLGKQNAEIRAENERLAGLIHDLEIVTRKSKRINYHLAQTIRAIYTKDSLCKILKDSKSKKSAIVRAEKKKDANGNDIWEWQTMATAAFAQ